MSVVIKIAIYISKDIWGLGTKRHMNICYGPNKSHIYFVSELLGHNKHTFWHCPQARRIWEIQQFLGHGRGTGIWLHFLKIYEKYWVTPCLGDLQDHLHTTSCEIFQFCSSNWVGGMWTRFQAEKMVNVEKYPFFLTFFTIFGPKRPNRWNVEFTTKNIVTNKILKNSCVH